MIRTVAMLLKNVLSVFALFMLMAGGVSMADTQLNLMMQSPWACKIALDGLSDFDTSGLVPDSLLDPDTERTLGVILADSSIRTMCNGGSTILRFSSVAGGLFVPVSGASDDNDVAVLTYTIGGRWGDKKLSTVGSAAAVESAQTLFSGHAVNGVLSLLITLDPGQRLTPGSAEFPFDGVYGDRLSLTLSTQP